MFILILKYVKPIEEVEKELNSHITYLEKYYSLKKFICSGRRNPRTGGVILCNADTIEEIHKIIKEDPFYEKKIAEYEIIEFIPTKYADEFKCFINQQ
ncbi:YciI family protein [Clostridium thailandense]|uniref:YciI family protein n=1 Tax=Clostridium thailandense TaxID=2794346 RepID=UPI003989FDF0